MPKMPQDITAVSSEAQQCPQNKICGSEMANIHLNNHRVSIKNTATTLQSRRLTLAIARRIRRQNLDSCVYALFFGPAAHIVGPGQIVQANAESVENEVLFSRMNISSHHILDLAKFVMVLKLFCEAVARSGDPHSCIGRMIT